MSSTFEHAGSDTLTQTTPAYLRVWRAAITTWLPRIHVVLGATFCIVLPALSWLDGEGTVAWTMFSKSSTYRVRVSVTRPGGSTTVLNPTQLALHAPQPMSSYLVGSDRWIHAPVGLTLRTSLHRVASLGCREPDTTAVDVELEERTTLDAPIVTSRAHVECVAKLPRKEGPE